MVVANRFRSRSSAPNLAPLVDVVMVILIFFMLGTSFAMSEGILPTRVGADSGGGRPAIAPVVRIGLSRGASAERCRIEVMGQVLAGESFDGLRDYLSAKRSQGADPQGRILIAAAPGVRYQFVVSALDACVKAGFRNVQFAVATGMAAGTAAAGRS